MDLMELSSCPARRHPWEMARSRFFLRVLKREGALCSDTSILDVGSGDAWFADQLASAASPCTPVTCWDVNYTATDLRLTQARQNSGLALTAERPVGRFGGILMLDVLEHVENDADFIRSIADDNLADDGWLLVSVPVYSALFTSHDVALKHFRRYSRKQCRSMLRDAGIAPRLEGSIFHSLLAIRAVQAVRERATGLRTSEPGVGAWSGGDTFTQAVTTVLELEGSVSFQVATRTGFVPPGLSYWAYCTRG